VDSPPSPLPIRTPARHKAAEDELRLARYTDGTSRLSRRLAPFADDDTTSTQRVALREGLYRRSLAVSDVLAMVAASVGMLAVDGGAERFRLSALLIIPLVILAAKLVGLYDRDELLIRKTTADEVPAILQVATVVTLVTWLGADFLLVGEPNRWQIVTLWFVLLLALTAGRWTTRTILAHTMSRERILVVGGPGVAERFNQKLSDNAVNAEVVGRLAMDEVAPTLARFGPSELGSLVTSLSELHVDRVAVAPDDGRPELTLDIIRAAKSHGVRVSVLPHMLEAVGSAVAYDDIFGLPVLGVRRFGLTRSSRAVKRLMDIAISGTLILLTLPLMAAIAIAIKLTSRGPVFFGQERMGRDGRSFRMLKFRTMVENADAMKDELREQNETSGLFKIADDPRITRVGRPLRQTSLDELPQFFNVLRGDMSMVGPRPLVPDEDAQITGLDRRRLVLPPGVTGPWQILGSGRVPLNEMVKIDYLYAANWSAWNDIKILLRTVLYVLRRGGM
jgi:exopolysaccharide biosynthesis polyprenyl glycosylphosphotransferase